MTNKKFDYHSYIQSVGEEVVLQFNRSKISENMVARGENKEVSIINKLSNILPEGVGIGSGFVFDIEGNVSRQCDIIIYEKNFAIKCAINDDEKNCYYNIESVIAVGEVKTSLKSKELDDCLTKFENLSYLKRYKHESQMNTFRCYLNKTSIADNFDGSPLAKEKYDGVYKFIFAETIDIPYDTILTKIKEIKNDEACFNCIVGLNNCYFGFAKNSETIPGRFEADTFFESKENYPFSTLIFKLIDYIQCGRTVPLNISEYFFSGPDIDVKNIQQI